MKVVRDRADARWLPSRYRFGVFKLMAWLIFRTSKPEAKRGLVLAVDRDQSSLENYTVAAWLVATLTLWVLAIVHPRLVWWLALPVAFIAAIILIHGFVVLPGLGTFSWRQQNHVEFNAFLAMLIMTAAAIYFAGRQTWVRHVGWSFLLIAGVNAVASIIVWLIRSRIAQAEQEIVSA